MAENLPEAKIVVRIDTLGAKRELEQLGREAVGKATAESKEVQAEQRRGIERGDRGEMEPEGEGTRIGAILSQSRAKIQAASAALLDPSQVRGTIPGTTLTISIAQAAFLAELARRGSSLINDTVSEFIRPLSDRINEVKQSLDTIKPVFDAVVETNVAAVRVTGAPLSSQENAELARREQLVNEAERARRFENDRTIKDQMFRIMATPEFAVEIGRTMTQAFTGIAAPKFGGGMAGR